MERFQACFAELADPRTGNAQRHELLEILLIALCATLCGAENCVDMALFGRAKEPFLRRFLRAAGRHTEPRHLLAPVPAARSGRRSRPASAASSPRFAAPGRARWWRSTARPRGARSTAGAGTGRSIWSAPGPCEQRLVLGQRRVDGDSNEIAALPELLALLALDGCIVTADAMHCQKATARRSSTAVATMCSRSRPTSRRCSRTSALLLDDPAAPPDDVAATTDGDHGRIETRRADGRPRRRLARRDATACPASRRSARSPPRREIDGQDHHRHPLLSAVQAARRRALRRDRARPLADREPAALGARRGHGRGPVRAPQGPPPEPRPPAPLRPQSAARQHPTRARPAARSSAPPGTTTSSSKFSKRPNAIALC